MGVSSSVNDMLVFCPAVLNCYDQEKGQDPPQSFLGVSTVSPLKNIASGIWDSWWTRPCEDGFENESAYALGWFRTTMPTSALGSMSYNSIHRLKDTIGKESEARTLYGNHGVMNGAVSTVYVLPASHSAVVVLSNAADAGDAAETTSQILLQALFDLKPQMDLLPSLLKSRRTCLQQHDAMAREWESHRDVTKYHASSDDYVGSYLGLGALHIDIFKSDKSTSGLAVVFAHQEASRCELEPFNVDALSFLPTDRDERLRRGMLDWDFWTVGVFSFVREDTVSRKGPVVGLWWKWDEFDDAGLWVKVEEGMSEAQVNQVIERHGRFLREPLENAWKGKF